MRQKNRQNHKRIKGKMEVEIMVDYTKQLIETPKHEPKAKGSKSRQSAQRTPYSTQKMFYNNLRRTYVAYRDNVEDCEKAKAEAAKVKGAKPEITLSKDMKSHMTAALQGALMSLNGAYTRPDKAGVRIQNLSNKQLDKTIREVNDLCTRIEAL
jgi:hypothetical protein|tara:strand:- start:3049 stop:3510 length:462 start_codon:yes stop_codon:yes gene_type:complete